MSSNFVTSLEKINYNFLPSILLYSKAISQNATHIELSRVIDYVILIINKCINYYYLN